MLMNRHWWARRLDQGLILAAIAGVIAFGAFFLDGLGIVKLEAIGLTKERFELLHSYIGVVALITLEVFIFSLCIYALAARTRQYLVQGLGRQELPDHRLAAITDALRAQREELISFVSWPPHSPTAQPARTPHSLDFGDAALTVSHTHQKTVRAFLTRPRKRRPQATAVDEVLVVTGEPGAGKSILLQEIHQSLSAGVSAKHHSLIPIVLLARSLTTKAMDDALLDRRSPFRQLLVNYLRNSKNNSERNLADFVESEWDNFDFLVMVDGLDEIAQRSAYEQIQHSLRDFIESEAHRGPQSVHKFILSCRIDDDIAIFYGSSKILLQGLATERQREKFCSGLIRNLGGASGAKANVRRLLLTSSNILASSDMFRRNPYFLTLLVEYLKARESKPLDAALDFEFLMNQFIQRETERPHAYVSGPAFDRQLSSREELRIGLEKVATTFLQFFAFHSMSGRDKDRLYGESILSTDLLHDFVISASRDYPQPDGIWGSLSTHISQLAANDSFSEEEIASWAAQGYLHPTDIRILRALAQKYRHSTLDSALVLDAFGETIFNTSYVEDTRWYHGLAAAIAELASSCAGDAKQTLSVLVFARGLMAAQILRLVYVTNVDGVFKLKFRHRRLAEYFAARYLREQWTILQPLEYSPWITPILNLVCAIEGERCWAFRWLSSRVASEQEVREFTWRYGAVAATEAAAFAFRSSGYRLSLSNLVGTFLAAMASLNAEKSERSNDRRGGEYLSLVALASALSRIADLKPTGIELDPAVTERFRLTFRSSSPQFAPYFAKAAESAEGLSKWHRRILDRLLTLLKFIKEPGALLGKQMPAARPKLTVERAILWVYVVLVEICIAIILAGAIALMIAMPFWFAGNSKEDIASYFGWYWFACTALILLIRVQLWRSAPTTSARWDAAPFYVGKFVFLTLPKFLLLCVLGIAFALYQIGRHILRIPQLLAKFIRWITNPAVLRSLWAKARNLLVRFLEALLSIVARLAVPVAISLIALVAVIYGSIWIGSYLAHLSTSTGGAQQSNSVPSSGNKSGPTASKSAGQNPNSAANGAAVPQGAGSTQAQAKVTKPDGSTPPATKNGSPPGQCDISAIHDGLIQKYAYVPTDATAAQIQSMREAFTRDFSTFRSRIAACNQPEAGRANDPDIVQGVLSSGSGYRLVPLPAPGSVPLLTTGDLDRILMHTRVPMASTSRRGRWDVVGLVKEQSAIMNASATFSHELELLHQALISGRIGVSPSVRYPTASEFVSIVETAIRAQKTLESAQKKLELQRQISQRHLFQTLPIIGVVIPLILWAVSAFGRSLKRRAENRVVRRLQGEPVELLCEAFKDHRYAESLRRRILAMIVKQEALTREHLALLSATADELSRRPDSLENILALELSEALYGLERRLQLRLS